MLFKGGQLHPQRAPSQNSFFLAKFLRDCLKVGNVLFHERLQIAYVFPCAHMSIAPGIRRKGTQPRSWVSIKYTSSGLIEFSLLGYCIAARLNRKGAERVPYLKYRHTSLYSIASLHVELLCMLLRRRL